jgi:NAD(P)-dependent dehydrogenase (short-subunit alcohol dehydrogenase family)
MERIPAGRWGAPADFEGVVVFLASRASDYVCGECITVDGGWMASECTNSVLELTCRVNYHILGRLY